MLQLRKLIALFQVSGDDAGLVISQYYAVNGQLPLLYIILLINTVTVAATHFHGAPRLLTIVIPGLLTIGYIFRITQLLLVRNRIVTAEVALRELRKTNRVTPPLSVVLLIWTLWLSSYGDTLAKTDIAFYNLVTAIGCILCLIHLRSVPLMVTLIIAVPDSILFLFSRERFIASTGANFCLVLICLLVVLNRHYRDFVALSKSRQELAARQAETQRLSDENSRLANIDTLTGLPNRRGFFNELGRAMENGASSNRMLAIGLIDMDGFKQVNDVYGHAAGDLVLHEVGRRLSGLASDAISFARLGGDEFGMLFYSEAGQSACETATEICASLREAYAFPAWTLEISASIGVAQLEQAGCTVGQLFERADYALYHAKQNARGTPIVFSASHQDALRDAASLDRVLRHADLQAEMFIVFQPIFDVERGGTVAVECLARWNSPELGLIEPTLFIKAAERCNVINRLTQVLLEKALAAARFWPTHVQISFNLSVYDIANEEAVHRIAGVVLASGIAPRRIEFEITETAVMRDFEQARQSLLYLRALGARIALDDFGTGYSSLSYVHRLPLDKIKVDRSFTIDIEQDKACLNIVTTVLDLCRNMKLFCVVEGLETAAQVTIMKELGCSLMQGYFFGRPMGQDDLTAYLAAEDPPTSAAPLYPIVPCNPTAVSASTWSSNSISAPVAL